MTLGKGVAVSLRQCVCLCNRSKSNIPRVLLRVFMPAPEISSCPRLLIERASPRSYAFCSGSGFYFCGRCHHFPWPEDERPGRESIGKALIYRFGFTYCTYAIER